MVQLTCPDSERWEALLADSSAPDEAAKLEAHLSSCPRCRTLLDDLAVGSSGWLRDAGRLATATSADPALTRTLHRLHDSAVDDHAVPPISLDFLTPSDQPGILGTLGRYQVLAVLGRGAMGIVLKALDPDLLRPVAIKVLAPYLAPSGTARQRFLREARAAAAVSHDHVVKIHGVEPAELPYIVMEYVTGVSLQARLDRDGPLPSNEIARIGLQAAQGLAAAHAVGLIHRDVKPANILLENGVERVKLTDFGLAQAADDARLTQSGVAAGTPLYMSPEQARGEKVDPRSDLFSLGSVLYALATGFPPFRAGSTMGVLNRITNDPPRPIRETIPDFPAALEKIIMQLLEKDPAKRFQIGADLSFRLTAFLAGSRQQSGPSDEALDEPEAAEGGHTSRWVTVLCLLAAAAMVATVLTFRTPKGTLVVEVDDPAIKVALDGEELTITGAGPQEVRLKPGTYELTASKDGKPVKQEVVTITRGGKQVVKVTVEPPAAPAVAKTPASATDAGHDTRPNGVSPPSRPVQLEPGRGSEAGWEGRQKKLINEFQALVGRLARTEAGRMLLITGPRAELDKLMVGLSAEDTIRAKRLISLRDQFGVLVPNAQKELDRWEKATLRLKDQDIKYTAGIISQNEFEAARLEVKQAERALKAAEDAMATIIADATKLADELHAPAANVPETDSLEADLKKVMAEYDALVLRLARHPVGRAIVVIPQNWNEHVLSDRGFDQPQSLKATKLLNLRDEIRVQAEKAQGTLNARTENRESIAKAKDPNSDYRARTGELIRTNEQSLKVSTETIRGLVGDLKKLADELDPPADGTAEEAAFERLMAEYDALVLRLAPNPVGRLLVVVDQNWNQDSLKDRGLDFSDRDTAVRLLNLRDEIRIQAAQANGPIVAIYNSRQAMAKATSPEARDGAAGAIRQKVNDLKLRTGTIRGLVNDLKKLADTIDPPGKKPTDEPPPGTDPKSELQSLRDQLKALDAEAKTAADLAARIEKEEKELQKMEADLPKVSGAAADDLRRQIDSARKTIVSLKNDLAIWKNRQGMRAGIQKRIDQLQKQVEPKKVGQ